MTTADDDAEELLLLTPALAWEWVSHRPIAPQTLDQRKPGSHHTAGLIPKRDTHEHSKLTYRRNR